MEVDKARAEQAGETEEYDSEVVDFTEEDGEVCHVGKGSKGKEKKGKAHA